MFVQHTNAAKGSYKFSREKTDEKKAHGKTAARKRKANGANGLVH